MNPKDSQSTDQPVAYDTNGQPLYARPQQATQPQQVVHVARSVEPIKQELSDEVKAKHAASMKQFPQLNISESEYIISAVRRHVIGLFLPVSVTLVLVIIMFAIMIGYPMVRDSTLETTPGATLPAFGDVMLVCLLFMVLFVIGGYIAVWVYLNNKFFLTNESVIQEIQTSLFTKKEQTVSLGNIEDASFNQKGIIQSLFDYGSIRLSTQGDETTYRFQYVINPKQQISYLNNAIEAFKNGRPTED